MLSEAKDKIDELTTVEGIKRNWTVWAVLGIFVMALWLRYRPEAGMAYLQALDPYFIYRLSQHIALEGFLPQVDFMRYFPYNAPTYIFNQGDLLFPAIGYWLGPAFFMSYLEWAQLYPALLGSGSVVIAYFLGKEFWDKKAGVFSAFFLATIAGVMHRTSAGFFEKEPIGTFFMMLSLYFFTRGWKYKERWSGILSGLTLGFFTISWGGSKMLWLLYPLVVGTVMLFNEDTEALIRTYTPTVLLGGFVAATLNFSRFDFTTSFFLVNIGLLAVLWARYGVEELELVEDRKLKYFIPTTYLLGAVGLALSPLYSNFLAQKVMSLLGAATQSGGGVIAGTVAENQAASLGQLVSQLGSVLAVQVNGLLGAFAYFAGTWPLAFVGIALMGTTISAMVLRKYSSFGEEINSLTYYKLFTIVFLGWLLVFGAFFSLTGESITTAAGPSIILVVAGLAVLYMTESFEGERKIDLNWYLLLPFFWVLTNLLGAVAKSRLVFLATFSIALTTGYMFSKVVGRIQKIDYSQFDAENAAKIRAGLLAAVIGIVLVVNGAAGYASTDRLSGSPSSAWDTSLDYIENETEPGSVIMSWWDYGYWFESIGRRGAVADGGNNGYYNSGPYSKVNYPLADYLTGDYNGFHDEFLRKHSVDYIVLDNTMKGKYSAVSQISNRDNSDFQSMFSLTSCQATQQGCRRAGFSNAISQNNGSQVATFQNNRVGFRAYVPLEMTSDSVDIGGTPTIQTSRGRIDVGCVLTDEGRVDYETERDSGFCIVEDPYQSFERGMSGGQSQVVVVPEEIADSNLVRLYLMNGVGMDYIEPVEAGSNGYVRMWEVNLENNN